MRASCLGVKRDYVTFIVLTDASPMPLLCVEYAGVVKGRSRMPNAKERVRWAMPGEPLSVTNSMDAPRSARSRRCSTATSDCIAHYVASLSAGDRHRRLVVTAVQRECCAHWFTVVTPELKVVGAPGLVVRVNCHATLVAAL